VSLIGPVTVKPARFSPSSVVRSHGLAAEGAGRRGGDDVQHAGDGALAEQGRLRPAQHFHPLDVDQVLEGGGLEADRHVVDDHRDVRLDGDAVREGADAAHLDAEIARLRAVVDRDRRRQLHHVAQFADVVAVDHVLGQGGDRHRHVLQALGALGRGDDDLLQLDRRVRTGGLGLGDARPGNDGDNGGRRQQGVLNRSHISPLASSRGARPVHPVNYQRQFGKAKIGQWSG
jgi:hypothetical protein